MRESGSKRAASSSPSRRSKRREFDVSDHSSQKSKDKSTDDELDNNGKSKKERNKARNRSKGSKKNRRSKSSSDYSERSDYDSGTSVDSDLHRDKNQDRKSGRYWSGEPEKDELEDGELSNRLKEILDQERKGRRYWGGEPGKEDLEESTLSKRSKEADYKVGSRYYDSKSEEKPQEPSTNLNSEYVVGKRYYEDKSKETSKEKESTDISKKEFATAPTRRAKLDDPLLSRTGGAYIPPAKLRLMQASITDKSSISYQRIAWEALKKSIHGHINKVNTSNIGIIARLLMKENIVRGRGLLCRSLLQAQAASPTFTNVYASLVSIINSKFPNIGELLLKRVILQFKRGFKRNDKALCISSCQFIAHLVNQQIAHEILALEMLTLLLESPTDDSVEVAVAFLKEVGQKLLELSPKGTNAIFDMLRNILHQGNLEKRVQYMIEVVFQVRKDAFRSFQSVEENLDLVEEEDRYTHILTLDEAVDPEDMLNVFKHDLEYELNEDKYKSLKEEIIGESSSEGDSGDEDSGEEDSEENTSDDEEEQTEKKDNITIIDETETNLVALRRTIYLTIQSSLDFEECCHKLLKMDIKPGQEAEVCHMLLDCCAELRTYEKFFGLLAQRFCQINRVYITPLEEMFAGSYATVHRLDTNKLRNVARFFGHLLFTDAISWQVLQCIRLNEEETTSSSRIFIKILFQELAEYMGLSILNQRLKDPTLQTAMEGLFPRDNPKNTRFAINFFTSIGLGGLTDELREHLKTQPKPSAVAQLVDKLDISSDSSSSDSSSSEEEDSSFSDSSEEDKRSKRKNAKKGKQEINTEHVIRQQEKKSEKDRFKENKTKVDREQKRRDSTEREKKNYGKDEDKSKEKNKQEHTKDYRDRTKDESRDRQRDDRRNNSDNLNDPKRHFDVSKKANYSKDKNECIKGYRHDEREDRKRDHEISKNRERDYNQYRDRKDYDKAKGREKEYRTKHYDDYKVREKGHSNDCESSKEKDSKENTRREDDSRKHNNKDEHRRKEERENKFTESNKYKSSRMHDDEKNRHYKEKTLKRK